MPEPKLSARAMMVEALAEVLKKVVRDPAERDKVIRVLEYVVEHVHEPVHEGGAMKEATQEATGLLN
jgi:hypothetical protein